MIMQSSSIVKLPKILYFFIFTFFKNICKNTFYNKLYNASDPVSKKTRMSHKLANFRDAGSRIKMDKPQLLPMILHALLLSLFHETIWLRKKNINQTSSRMRLNLLENEKIYQILIKLHLTNSHMMLLSWRVHLIEGRVSYNILNKKPSRL